MTTMAGKFNKIQIQVTKVKASDSKENHITLKIAMKP